MTENTFDTLISKWSGIFSVPFELIKAIIKTESNFNPLAKAPTSSASGLMQIIQRTAQSLNNGIKLSVEALWNPDTNIKLGTKLLAQNLKATGGDTEKAVAMYYGGSKVKKGDDGRWYRWDGNGWNADVNSYVDKVMRNYQKYSGSSSPPQAASSSGETGSSGGGPGTDMALLLLAGFVGLLFLKRWKSK